MITAPELDRLSGLRHAFFTRRGGVSEGPFASLNCGYGSGDDPGHVDANRARAMERLGMNGGAAALVTAYQTHSTAVAVVEKPWMPAEAPKADGLATRHQGVALGVLSADCAPVLLAETRNRVVGAAHAGWRGAGAGILEATVAAMVALGAEASAIVAAVGPCIGRESYQVGGEFYADFVAREPASGDMFRPTGDEGRYLFDLRSYIAWRLAGLGLEAVEVLDHDTFTDMERFFSYRRSRARGEEDYGRGLSAIALDPV